MKKHLLHIFLSSVLLLIGNSPLLWSSTTDVVGLAATNTNNYDYYLNINRQNWGWYSWKMSKADITFEGKKLYVQSFETDNGWYNNFQFLEKEGDTQKSYKETYNGSGQSHDTNNKKIYNYDNSSWYSAQTVSINAKLYFDATGWSSASDKYKLVVGHANFQRYYTMSPVSNTKLYYVQIANNSWSDAMGIGVVGNTSASDGNNWLTNVSAKATEFTGFKNYGLTSTGADNAYLMVNAGKAGEQPTMSYNNSYTTLLHSTQTVYSYVKSTAAGSYTLANSPIGIAFTSYNLSNQGTSQSVSDPIAANTDNTGSLTAVRTATTTITVGTVPDGYTLDGIFESASGGSRVDATLGTYTYYPTTAKTHYVRFHANTYTISLNDQSATTGGTNSVTATFNNSENLTSAITVPKKTHFLFGGYYTSTDGNGVQLIDANGNWLASKSDATYTYTDASRNWKKASNTILYAYWIPISITDITLTPAAGNANAQTFSVKFKTNATKTQYKYRVTTFGAVGSGTAGGGYYLNDKSIDYDDGRTFNESANFSSGAFSGSGTYTAAIEIYNITGAVLEATQTFTYTATACTTPTISWSTRPVAGVIGDNMTISVTSNYPTGVTLSSNNTSVATVTNKSISGSTVSYTLTYVSAGEATISASVTGDGSTYCEGPAVESPITISVASLGAITANSAASATVDAGVDVTLSVTSTYLPDPVVVFMVTDASSNTYEIVATTGAIGSSPSYSTTHTATFTTNSAGAYTVSAKLYAGKLMDNVDGADKTWVADNGGSFARVNNPSKGQFNYSNQVLQVSTNNATVDYAGAILWNGSTRTEFNISGYGYIHTREYRPVAHSAGKISNLKANDNPTGDLTGSPDATTELWQKRVYNQGTANPVNFIYLMPQRLANATYTVYYDDIILSKESSMTNLANPSSTASVTIRALSSLTTDKNAAGDASGVADPTASKASIGYDADQRATVTAVAAPTGYSFSGWTLTNCTRTDGGAATLLTITIRSNGDGAAAIACANYTANTYTIAFDPNDDNYVGEATGTMSNQGFTYGVSQALTANGFSREGYTFAGWSRNADGTGTQYTNSQSVSNLTPTNGATVRLYAKWTGKTYTVTFNARGGSSLSASSTTVTMGATYGEGTDLSGEMPTVTAPTGYIFDGWYTASVGGTKVTKTTQVTTASDHTLYAHYVQKAQVYFKNTLGWNKVYVTYDAYWVAGSNKGAGNNGKTYHKMKLVAGTTDVYYDDIPDAVLTEWKWNIAFDNSGFCAAAQKENPTTGTSQEFYGGEAVFRYDFDSKATMFVPTSNTNANEDGNFNDVNSTQYRSTGYTNNNTSDPNYTSGYWRTYNNTYSGYTMTYQKSTEGGTWHGDNKLIGVNGTTNTFIYTLTLDANSTYYFSMYKQHAENNRTLQFGRSYIVKYNYCTDIKLESKASNLTLNTTAAGEYIFKLELKEDGHMYLSVEYPVRANDYRVVYTWNDGSAHTYNSEIIRAAAGTDDTISVFVHKEESPITSRSMKIQYCSDITAGVATWTDVTDATIALTDITESGVYDFIITQPASGNPTGAYYDKYTGNYYIRTDASDGGWDMYKYRPDNIMTLSEYSLTQTLSAPYSHYYCRYIESTTMDITYAVATDYSPNISGILVGDATIGGDGNKTLPASANVRFTWNQETNALRRAYLKSAQGSGNTRFLVLHGKEDEHIFNADGTAIAADDERSLADNELLFSDLGNWVYQVELQAKPGAKVSLIARYNGETSTADRYLIGSESSWMEIMGGDGTNQYDILAVFDFKTNRLMTVWTPPSEGISDELKNVDMLLIRHKQEDATSVTFNPGGSLTTKKVYGAIRLDYDELVGHVASWTTESRPLLKYMISFPFDVNISDIFGLNSRYGDAYVIQKYDGADRAARGFFRGDGTTTFWKDMEQNEVMRANVGYCVIFDNDYLNGDLGAIWEHKSAGSKVYLYFPSAGNVGTISSSTKEITVTPLPCNIDRAFTVGTGTTRTLNHKYTDSNWNLIGVPIFQNSTGVTSSATITYPENTGDQTGSYGPFYYFYDYDVANNQYRIASATGYEFKTMYSYMLQYAGKVTFTGSTPSSVAARRIADTKKYEIELQVLRNDEEVINRTFVNLKENACDTFALNEDVYMSPNSAAVNIYTLAGNYDVAANILSIDNHIVPVGVEVSKAGNYSFSMPSDFDGTVVLVDNFDGSRTDLSLGDYSVALPKGTIEDRFTLEINIERSSATDIEGIEGGDIKDGKAHKFVRDGIMYILRDGVIYDAMGKRVK